MPLSFNTLSPKDSDNPMSADHSKPSKVIQTPATTKRRRFGRWLLGALLVAIAVVAMRYGFEEFGTWKVNRALRHRDSVNAQWWLDATRLVVPENAETAFLHARIARRAGDTHTFRQSLAKADQLGFASTRLSREQVLMLAQLGQLRGIEPRFREYLLDPGDDGQEICEAFVSGYYLNHRLDEVALILETWAAEFPDDPQPYLFRGKIKAMNHEYAGAADDLQHAIKLDPSHLEAHFELGCVRIERGQPGESITHFRRAMGHPRFRQRARVKLAMCLGRQSKYQESQQLLSEVLAEEPLNADALLERGKVRLLNGDQQGAVRDLQALYETVPHQIEARYQLGIALTQSGRAAEAAPHLKFANAGQDAMQAAERLVEQVAKSPSNVDARFEAGMIFLKYGQDQKGLHWLRSILNYAPDDRRAINAIADWYQRKSQADPQFQSAAQSYQDLLGEPSKESRQP